ncbi:hypothetical protein [Arsukibacterium sp.]|uniref:hypothetical protein n=1 Tax=Arsukibacterium sp. TaxID=1977258 RepID=UPI00299DEC5D|nr:hypothetical protein [Arsukibacterium sp.]MDX1676426.1 hypothetical protein [Arsukibacterium sp.]
MKWIRTGSCALCLLLMSTSQAQQVTDAAAQPPQPAPSQMPSAASRPAVEVNISTTISGNQQQPRTLYVLPWQDSIAQIRIPAPDIQVPPEPIQPLDRQQFLRFIEAQSLQQQPAGTVSTENN